MYHVERIVDELMRAINHMNTQQWLVVSTVAVVMGAMFLRGFGSRSSY